ncbi:hypothetical protein EE612_002235, partial [Oryza sativa]
GPGPREVGPTRQPHGPRWTGRRCRRRSAPVGSLRYRTRGRWRYGRAHLAASEGTPGGLAKDGRREGTRTQRSDGRRRRLTGCGAAPERGGKGKRRGRSTAHPETNGRRKRRTERGRRAALFGRR